MPLPPRSVEQLAANVPLASGSKDQTVLSTPVVFLSPPSASPYTRKKRTALTERLRKETQRPLRFLMLPTFFAGLAVGCLATGTINQSRDHFGELTAPVETAYKMKVTLLKTQLLLQSMDSVIEKSNKEVLSTDER